jgi:hypothetical protein
LKITGKWLAPTILAAAMLLASCSSPAATTTTTKTTTPSTPAGPTVLTVTNGSKSKSYSVADLQALKAVTGNGGTKNKTGAVAGPFPCKGVALTEVLNAVGGLSAGQSVKLTASDGYSKTLTFDQVTGGSFSMYDTSGNPATPASKPVPAVVYSSNGTALDSATGPTEFGVLSDQNLVSDGSSWVKMLKTIDVIAGP